MDRRIFLNKLKSAAIGIGINTFSYSRCASKRGSNKIKNWLWYRHSGDFSNDEYEEQFKKIKAAGIDAILPEVYNSRQALYRSQHLPSSCGWLEQILPLAKSAGLEVHAWMWSMPCNIPQIHQSHPQWFAVNGRGESTIDHPAYVNYYKFMCPNHDGVMQFIQKTAEELARFELLDGVHFDYIRLPDVILAENLQPKYNIVQDREYPQYDYCYCQVCRSKFKEQTGKDPRDLPDPAKDPDWRQFRFDSITNMVNNILIPVVKKYHKTATAAVFPNWQHVRQEWFKWDLDAVLPMLYHQFYNQGIDWIQERTAEEVQLLGDATPLYSGLFVPDFKPEQLIKAIQAALNSGAKGIALFSAAAMTEKHWQAFSEFTGTH